MSERLKVGDVLWYVPTQSYYGSPREVTVTKVGRRWAETDGGGHRGLRLDMGNLRADGGDYSSPGQAYRDRDAYEASVALGKVWSKFQRWVGSTHQPPPGVDLEWITAAAERLGIKL